MDPSLNPTRGWEIVVMGVAALGIAVAQVALGKAMRWRHGQFFPEWVPWRESLGWFVWGVTSMTVFGAFSVWYGVTQVLLKSN